MLKSILALSLLSIGVHGSAAVQQKKEEICPLGPEHMRASVRHIEAGGIGYQDGYTTLEMFLASDPNLWAVMPFLDLRGHVFNNGQGALNVGAGIRGMYRCRAYGTNVYYDYRTTHRKSYNQVGVGFETLGSLWDFRANGYFPVGGKVTNGYDLQFDSFSGNSLFVTRKFQYAMTGFDAELGFHFGKTKNFDFYTAFGPYYFVGKMGDGAAGGKARLAGYYKDYVTLEISDSYDSVFRNNFQGQITLTLPFGPKAKTKITKSQCPDTCSMASTLNTRMVQPVGRQEIIVVDKHKKKQVADNTILFVNNTSNSAGTFESPYPTLDEALAVANEGDIIYIYSGDGTSTGLDAGATPFVLQNNQQLLGAATNQTVNTNFGSVVVPAQAQLLPYLTANADTNVIQVANGNVISGLHISMPSGSGSSWAIGRSADITNLTVSNSLFQSENTSSYLINLGGGSGAPQGTVTVSNNQFLSNGTAPHAIYINRDNPNSWTLNVTGNTFTGFVDNSIICTSYDGATTMSVTNNQFLNASADNYVLYISSEQSSVVNLNFSDNMMVNDYGLDLELYNDATINCTLNGNNMYVYDQALYMYPNDTSTLNVIAQNNFFSSDGGEEECIYLDAYATSQTNLAFSNNQIDVSGYDQSAEGFYLYSSNESTLNFTSINNKITCAGYYEPYGIYFAPDTSSSVTAVIQGCKIQALDAHDEGYGIYVRGRNDATIDLTVKDCTILASYYGIQTDCNSNVEVYAVVENNNIRVTADGAYAVSATMGDTCLLDLSCNSNWMTAPQAIEVTSTSTNAITANFTGNTMYGQGEQTLVDLASGANGTMTVGLVSNRLVANTGSSDPAVQISQSAGAFYFDFEKNNVISGGYGILTDTNTSGSTMVAHVIGNTLQTLAGDSFTAQSGAGNVCFLYENNIANAPNSFVNSGAGVFTLYYEGNNQTYSDTGITPGTATSCPFP